MVKLLPDKNSVFFTIASAFDKKCRIFIKKSTKKPKKSLFCSFSDRFPRAIELGSPQKIGDRHGLFAGLLDVRQVDETVFHGDFEELFVVGDDATNGQIRLA